VGGFGGGLQLRVLGRAVGDEKSMQAVSFRGEISVNVWRRDPGSVSKVETDVLQNARSRNALLISGADRSMLPSLALLVVRCGVGGCGLIH
jgi:hypothetical protein